MVAKFSSLDLEYLPSSWANKVQEICQGWEGTPYVWNRCIKGVGVDCIHFAAAVLDSLYGQERSKNLKSLPPDAGVHNKKAVWRALRHLLETYPSHQRVRDNSIEAGDLVITGRSARSAPSHVAVAGKSGFLWEASHPCVRHIGYSLPEPCRLIAIYRASDKGYW